MCLLRAGQPRSAGDAAKSGQFIGQFSWVTGDPIVLKGLNEFESNLERNLFCLFLLGVRLSSLLSAADVPSRNQTTISSMMKRQTMPATATLEASQTANSEMDATCSAANINSPTKTDSNDSTISNASEISECETVVENGAREFAPCQIKTFVCPICNIAQPTEGLIDLNRHIDECLNRQQVRQILADDSKKKKSRCDELPEATNGKRQKLNKSKPASAGSLLKYFNSNG